MAGEKKYGMVVDTRKCVGCVSCTVSCKMENKVPFDGFRAWLNIRERGTFPEVKRHFLPRLCNHCENAPCVQVCPVKATYKREDGVVIIDEKRCIGCGYCITACPYHARYLHPQTKVADKCSFCQHRIDQGLEPACVRNCMGKARVFGDLNDPATAVSKVLGANPTQTLLPEFGTNPKVYYISADLNVSAAKEGKVSGA